MPGSMERCSLHVEGEDDRHSITHLLIRHGVDYDSKPWPPEFPEFKPIGGDRQLLEGMQTAVRLSSGQVIGFVLDADSPLTDRWHAVRDRLQGVGVSVPGQPVPEGFIGYSPTYKARVGVWLMPDNEHEGKLETFLRTLIDEKDSLIEHAVSATRTAKRRGARFVDADHGKATLHAWLAWQEKPGLPYGTAIRAKYFRHDSAAAGAFVAWFKRLYGIG